MYETGTLGDDAWVQAGYLNLPKDLSVVNRRGYASTTRKGVPLVYRVAITMSQHTLTGRAVARDSAGDSSVTEETDTETAPAADNSTLMKVLGCQNNWVMRNAAVKWHAAREEFFRRSDVTKAMRGAYAHEVRYNFDAASQSWLTSYDGDGATFTGGTWDVSTLADSQDSSYQLCLVGTGIDETAASGVSVLAIGDSYLKSRMTPNDDSNLEASVGPAKFSHLNDLLVSGDDSRKDDTHTIAQGEADNMPYDVLDYTETAHDITEPVELGRLIAGPGNAVSTVICDIPFGLAELNARHSGSQDQTIIDPVAFGVEVLDIFEMQG